MQRCRGSVSSSDGATGSYFYPAARLTKHRCLPLSTRPPLLKFPPLLPPFSLPSGGVQDEENRSHQMGDAGGGGTGVQHQALQSPSVHTPLRSHMLQSVLAFLFSPPPPAEINMGSRGCLHAAEARVGSGAPREPFISLTEEVGKKNEGCDGRM